MAENETTEAPMKGEPGEKFTMPQKDVKEPPKNLRKDITKNPVEILAERVLNQKAKESKLSVISIHDADRNTTEYLLTAPNKSRVNVKVNYNEFKSGREAVRNLSEKVHEAVSDTILNRKLASGWDSRNFIEFDRSLQKERQPKQEFTAAPVKKNEPQKGPKQDFDME